MRSAHGHSQIPMTAHGLRTPMARAEIRRGMRGDVARRRLHWGVYGGRDTLTLRRRGGAGLLRGGQVTGLGRMHRLGQSALGWSINIHRRVWRLHRDRRLPRRALCERVDRTYRLRGEGMMERDVGLFGWGLFRCLDRFCHMFVGRCRRLPTRIASFPFPLLLGSNGSMGFQRRLVLRIGFGY